MKQVPSSKYLGDVLHEDGVGASALATIEKRYECWVEHPQKGVKKLEKLQNIFYRKEVEDVLFHPFTGRQGGGWFQTN